MPSRRAAKRRRHGARDARLNVVAVATSLAAAVAFAGVQAQNNAPRIDFEALGGSLEVAGNFAGLELWDASLSYAAGTARRAGGGASLVALGANGGQARRIGQTDGSIYAIQQCGSAGQVFYAGNFTSSGSISARNIGVYHPQNDTIAPVSDGLDGPVHALACDETTQTLYVGGSFNRPAGAGSSYRGAVATWSTTSNQWAAVPFGGFPGSDVDIRSIAISAQGGSKSIIFGGSFDTYWVNGIAASSNVTVTTLANGTVAISSSNLTTASSDGQTVNVFPSYGSSLIPISLASAETSSSASTSNSRYSDPKSILCPAGNDGEDDSTWLAQDGTTGRITARLFAPLDVGGFRIGNTNVEGRGAQTFSITAIPTNEVVTLAYRTDPTSASSAISTCSAECPLSHDASIAYEDFLIAPTSGNSTVALTGFAITLNSHFGASAGLHLLQLLSAGSVSYSIDGQNRGYGQGVCSSGPYAVYGRSSSTHAPTSAIPWDHTEVASSTVAGTSEGILCAATPVDTDPADAPEATWYPYIAQDGTYEIQYFTPACAFDSTCGQRGFVDVTVEISGSQGTTSTVTTINQEVTFDTNTLIYSGPIQPISEQQQVKVTMQLSSRQKATLAPGRGDKYYLIADKIIVLAQNTDGNGSTQVKIGTGANAVNVTSADTSRMISYTRGYSLWEWVEGSTGTSSPTLDVASTAPQQPQNIDNASGLDRLSFALGSSATILDIATSSDGAFTFIAGDFNYSSGGMTARSILTVASGTAGLVSAPQGGLDGPVSSIAVLNGWLYAVGAFNASANGLATSLNGKARCQYASLAARWEPVAGLDTTAVGTAIATSGENVLFGYAGHALDTWSSPNSSLITQGRSFVAGNLTAISSGASDNGNIYLAGQISTLAASRSNGFGSLITKGIQPSSVTFDTDATAQQASSISATRVKRRALHNDATSEVFGSALDLLKSRLRRRQSSPVMSVPSALPSRDSATNTAAPEILAGVYWQNSSSKAQVTILGGRFVTSDGIANLAVLDSQGQLQALGDQALTGTISSLAIIGSTLWVGGDYTIASQRMQLAPHDLQSGRWQPSVALAADSAQPSITAITARGDNIVIAGHFSSVAEQTCKSICEWDGESKAWAAYGAGLTGVVSSVSILKSRLFAAGSFVSNNTSVYVATWDYDTSFWDYLGSASLPGPALSITADSENSVFASGVLAADTGTSYLWHFNGATWTDVTSSTKDTASLNAQTSNIQQIALVPLASEQPANSLFASGDRALMVSGQLDMNNFGDASSALFDGSSWYPYLLSSTLSGQPGSINSLFYPASTIAFGRSHHLAIGLVILISMAIALGVVFLGVLIALIIVLSTRHDDSQAYPVVVPPYDNGEWAKREATSPTPFLAGEKGHSKLETLGAATAAVAAGHPVAAAAAVAADRKRHTSGSTGEAATSSDDGSIYADMEEGDDSLPLRGVRYSFDAEREEELSIRTNDMVEVVDDTDEHWHIVRRLRDGRQGLVPSAFLT